MKHPTSIIRKIIFIALKLALYWLAIDSTGTAIDYFNLIHLEESDSVQSTCILAFYPLQYLVPFLMSVYTYNGNVTIWAQDYCTTISKVSMISSFVLYFFYNGFFLGLVIDISFYLLDLFIRKLGDKYSDNKDESNNEEDVLQTV